MKKKKKTAATKKKNNNDEEDWQAGDGRSLNQVVCARYMSDVLTTRRPVPSASDVLFSTRILKNASLSLYVEYSPIDSKDSFSLE